MGVRPVRNPTDVTFIGSITWRETAPFDGRDLAALASERRHVPGADSASLVAVVPQLILSLFVQKYIVRGLTMGAIR